jgi:hypothetical protein
MPAIADFVTLRKRHGRRAMLPSLCLALCLIALGSPAVQAQSGALEAMPREATPQTVVVPEFPAGAGTAPAEGVRVDVTGTVRADGSFEPLSISAEGGHAPFVAAVTSVVKWWRFLPAVDEALCAPVDAAFKLAVWFEGSAAQPRIFVSQPAAKPKAEPPPFESIRDQRLTFNGSVEGQVRVLMLVTPEGRVKSAQVRLSDPPGYFDKVVLGAARRTLVTWKSPVPVRDVCVQREYAMCFGSQPGITRRHATCESTR